MNPAAADRRGFTLVELLVVMVIIGILIGLVFPLAIKARAAADRHRAEVEVQALATALRAYLQDYNKAPSPTATQVTADMVTILTADPVKLTGSLLTTDNPRRRAFLKVSAISTNSAGAMVDPWETTYFWAVDRNFDNVINNSDGVSSMPGGISSLQGQSVAVWSLGPNQTVNGNKTSDTAYDDVTSW